MNKKGVLIAMMCLTAFLSILYVRSRFLVVELSLKIQEAQKTKSQYERQKNLLMLELETLKNPKRIEKIVSEHLGLHQYASPLVVALEDNRDTKTPNTNQSLEAIFENVGFVPKNRSEEK